MKTFGSQIENKEKLSYDLWFKTLKDSKVRVAKDHGKKFRSRLASSFAGIVHSSCNLSSNRKKGSPLQDARYSCYTSLVSP